MTWFSSAIVNYSGILLVPQLKMNGKDEEKLLFKTTYVKVKIELVSEIKMFKMKICHFQTNDQWNILMKVAEYLHI